MLAPSESLACSKGDGSMQQDGITIGMNGMSVRPSPKAQAKPGAKKGAKPGAKPSGCVQPPVASLISEYPFCESPRTGDWKKQIKAEAKDGEGIQLEDLELLDILGQGTSGMVQRCKHKPTGRFMALKVRLLNVPTMWHATSSPRIC